MSDAPGVTVSAAEPAALAARPASRRASGGGLLAPLILCAIGCLLALGLLEGALRIRLAMQVPTFIGSPVLTDDVEVDPILSSWYRPNYRSPDGHFTYDARGLRTNGEPRDGYGPDTIALLGGSTAYGFGEDDRETITAAMERQLRSQGQPSAEVVNGGFPGLMTLDTILVYERKIAAIHPRTTVVLAGLNDIYYAADEPPDDRFYWGNKVFEIALRARKDPVLSSVTDAVEGIDFHHCYTCYYLGWALGNLAYRPGGAFLHPVAAALGQPPLAEPNPRAMELTAWALGDLAQRVHRDGGCFVIAWQPIAGVTAPVRTDVEQRALEHVEVRAPAFGRIGPIMYQQLRELTRPLIASGAAHEVDLSDVFGDNPRPYAEDGVHYSPSANQQIGAALDAAIRDSGCS